MSGSVEISHSNLNIRQKVTKIHRTEKNNIYVNRYTPKYLYYLAYGIYCDERYAIKFKITLVYEIIKIKNYLIIK
jgi:hypothetical protein